MREPVAVAELEQAILQRLAQGQSADDLLEVYPLDAAARVMPARNGSNVARHHAALANLRAGFAGLHVPSEASLNVAEAALLEYSVAQALLLNELDDTEQRLRSAGLTDKLRRAQAHHAQTRQAVQTLSSLATQALQNAKDEPAATQPTLAVRLWGALGGAAQPSNQALTAALQAIDQARATSETLGPENWLRASSLPAGVRNLPVHSPQTNVLAPVYAIAEADDPRLLPDALDLSEIPAYAAFDDALLLKAEALGYDYVRIYEYVLNDIQTQWYAGSSRGAIGTLRAGQGNSVDQASLLIALLRASGVPSRFVHGVIELSVEQVAASLALSDSTAVPDALRMAGIAYTPIVRGGRVAAVELEHTWVAAKVPYGNYRGALVDTSGQTWIPMDTAIKPWRANYPSGALRQALQSKSSQAWLDDFIRTPQNQDLLSQLREQVKAQQLVNSDEQYQALLGGAYAPAEAFGLLPNSLPYRVKNVFAEAAQLDARFQSEVALRLYGADGALALSHTLSFAQASAGRLTLSFQPATQEDHRVSLLYGGMDLVPIYLIDVRASLRLDGEQIGIGAGILETGSTSKLEITLRNSASVETLTKHIYTPAYHAIAIGHGEPTRAQLPIDEESEAARQLDGLALRYMREWRAAEDELAALNATPLVRPLPAVAVTGTAFAPKYLSGAPYTHQWKGVTMDALLRVTEPVGSAQARRDFVRLSALQGSFLEHYIFEDQLKVDSVSADKVLAQADQEPLQVNAANLDATLASLDVHDAIKTELRLFVQLGYKVILSGQSLQRNIWNGRGWWVEDPATGSSGWFISGRLAGGSTTEEPSQWALQLMAAVFASAHGHGSNQNPTQAANLQAVGAWNGQMVTANQWTTEGLSVRVSDSRGTSVEGVSVVFQAFDGEFEGGKQAHTAVTDAFGIARSPLVRASKSTDVNPTHLLLNPQDEYVTRAGRNYVDAYIVGEKGRFSLPEPMVLNVLPDTPTQLNVTKESGLAAPNFASSVFLEVLDQYDNPVANAVVTASSSAGTSSCDDKSTMPLTFSDGASCQANVGGNLCGATALELRTKSNGVVAYYIIAGNSNNMQYALHFAAAGQNISRTIETHGTCQGTELNAFIAHNFPVDKFGQAALATVPGDESQLAIPFDLYYMRHDYWFDGDNNIHYRPYGKLYPVRSFGSVAGQYELGASLRAEVTGASTFNAFMRSGPVPALYTGQVHVDNVEVLTDTKRGVELRQVPVSSSGPSIWGVQVVIDDVISAVGSDPLDPGVVHVNDFGRSAYPAALRFSILPQAYSSDFLWLYTLHNDQLHVEDLWLGNRANQSVLIPKGTPFDLSARYLAQAVLNAGSANAIPSEPFPIPLNSRIVRDYTRSASLRTDVDLVNDRSCRIGASFDFTLNVSATMTLTATALDDDASNPQPTGAAVTLIDAQEYAEGESSFALDPDILLPRRNGYLLELTAESASLPGQIEQLTARLNVSFEFNDAVPLQHTLIKGVNVKSGRMVQAGPGLEYTGRGPQLAFRPMYSSAAGSVGAMGRNWTHNLDASLSITPCGDVIINAGDGGSMRFLRNEAGQFIPNKGHHGSLILNPDNTFDFYGKGGSRYHFQYVGAQRAKWQLKTATDPNGNTLNFSFNTEGDLVTATDGAGRVLSYQYQSATIDSQRVALMTEVRGPDNQRITISYDALGNVTAMDKNQGAWTESYGYALPGHSTQYLMTSRTDPAGQVTSFTYDETPIRYQGGGNPIEYTIPTGRVASITATDGGVTQFDYATLEVRQPQTTIVTDERGANTTYTTNAYGSVVQIDAPAGTTRMEWDSLQLYLLSRTEPGAITTEYTYDAAGNIATEVKAGVEVKSHWLIQTAAPFIKDRLLSRTDGRAYTTTYEYDARGNLLKETRPESVQLSHTYAANGDRLTTTNGNGHTTRFTWDARGMPASQTDPLNRTSTFEHDVRGRLIKTVVPATTDTGVTHHQYDSLDRLISTSLADGGIIQYQYDSLGNKSEETDPEMRTTTWSHDPMGRILTHTTAAGTKTYTYDKAGNKKTETNWRGQALAAYDYDPANRLVDRREQSSAGELLTQYTYDAAGNLATETDPRGHTTTYSYDAFGRRTQTTDAAAGIHRMEYDNNGNLLKETNPRGHATTHSYDGLNQRRTSTYPDAGTASFVYDKAGQLLTQTQPEGRTTTRQYDAAGQLIKLTDAQAQNTEYQYDNAGNLLREIDARLKARSYQYDVMNRRLQERDGEGHASSYNYDKVGNLVRHTQANGNVIVHRYDALNRRIETTDSLGLVGRWEYDADGNLSSETDAKGQTSTHSYDAKGLRTGSTLPAL
ncbi:transglutaminase domain-containing protein [Lampropedia aestuarii]|nr:transglutaminase domain-containing protein [Lampropedia aestuarii]